MTIGRNELCPCGSGKKHKKCCLQTAPEPTSYVQEKLNRFHERIIKELFRHADKVYGPDAFAEAIAEFYGWPEEEDADDLLEEHDPLFYPWFLFNWRMDEEDAADFFCPANLSVAESYMKSAKGKKLDPLEREYLVAYAGANPSFFEVIDTTPRISVVVRDLLIRREYTVLEKSASQVMREGDVIFGSVIEVGGIAIFGLLGPVPLLSSAKITILETWANMVGSAPEEKCTPEMLYDHNMDLRLLYLDLAQARTTPPVLANTDGETLSFHTLKYNIAAPQKVFDALKDLTGGFESEERLLREAEFDDQGVLHRVEIPWLMPSNPKHGGMDNTLHGRIFIKGQAMKCEVNSAKRAERLRAIIEERLPPEEALYRTTLIKSAEAMMREKPSTAESRLPSTHEELMALPEVRAKIDEMMCKHWEKWLDMELPILHGRTPRQAVNDPIGRQSVVFLLEDAERHCRNSNGTMGDPEVFCKVRQELGL